MRFERVGLMEKSTVGDAKRVAEAYDKKTRNKRARSFFMNDYWRINTNVFYR